VTTEVEQRAMFRAFHDRLMEALDDRLSSHADAVKLSINEAADAARQAPTQHVELAIPGVTVQNRVETPEVHVHGEAPQVIVQVDMTPVADAIKLMTRELSNWFEVVSQLVHAFSEQRPPQVEVNLPPARITVEPQINLPAAAPAPERKKRELVIRHHDGTESTIKEK
jgi:hypothetical protein